MVATFKLMHATASLLRYGCNVLTNDVTASLLRYGRNVLSKKRHSVIVALWLQRFN